MPSRFGRALLICSLLSVLCLQYRPEFVSVNQHTALIAILAQAACDHLDRHANLDRLAAQVGQLGGHQRAFFQLDQRHRIGGGIIETGRGFVNGGIREYFPFAAEREGCFGLASAIRSDIAGREDLGKAVWADFSHQSIALLFQSPMTGDFHNGSPCKLRP